MQKSKEKCVRDRRDQQFFKDIDLTEERIEKIIEFLEQKNVDVLQISEDKDTDDDMILELENNGEVRTMMRSRISICLCRMVSVLRIRYVCI